MELAHRRQLKNGDNPKFGRDLFVSKDLYQFELEKLSSHIHH